MYLCSRQKIEQTGECVFYSLRANHEGCLCRSQERFQCLIKIGRCLIRIEDIRGCTEIDPDVCSLYRLLGKGCADSWLTVGRAGVQMSASGFQNRKDLDKTKQDSDFRIKVQKP